MIGKPIAPLVTGFVREHMPIARGYSSQTCETYSHALRLLFSFAAERLRVRPSDLRLEQIDVDLVLAFLSHIERDRGSSAATRNARLAAVRAFMRYVELREPGAFEQVRRIRDIPFKRRDLPLLRHLSMSDVRCPCNTECAGYCNTSRHPRPCHAPSVLRLRAPCFGAGWAAARECFSRSYAERPHHRQRPP